jgi:hypothetical protein
MRRARVQTVLSVVAEPPRTARFQPIIPAEEVDHDEPNHIGSQRRPNRRGAARLGKRMLFDRGCGGAVDQGPRWEICGPGSAMAADRRRGITWLDAEVIGQCSHAVSSGERHILALVEALALGGPLEDVGGLMASLDPYHLGLVLAVLRHAGWSPGSSRLSIQEFPTSDGLGVDHGDDRR